MKTANLYSTGKQQRAGAALGGAVVSFFLIVAALLVSFPFVWMIRSSLMLEEEAMRFPPLWIPSQLTLAHYFDALTIQPFGRYIVNSLFIAIVVVIGQLLTASMGAYAFARLRFPGRDRLFLLYLATMMVPGQVTLIPVYVLISKIGWVDNYLALIVPGLFSVYLTFLLRQFFLLIPGELEDAARIDGAGYFRTYWTIFIPLSQPALATCALLAFMGSWTSFLWPLIVIRTKELRTVPIGLAALQQQMGYVDFPQLMAGSVMAILPIFILFLFLQRYFIEGIALTGLKG
ncbi:MAG TPA: carbohydrate ABC transporter permease [Caldilineaceae bacterium]|nr:carbohydrate ABC transporter permease [Caldilineaceae bacterium]